jgi:hypothetical protein
MAKKQRPHETGFAFETKAAAVAFAHKVGGKGHYREGSATYECPANAVMTTKIGKETRPIRGEGTTLYRYWVAVGCRLKP